VGVIHGCHYFVPKFKQQGFGAIINVASAASYTAAPEMTAYNVTKSSVLALSETLASELHAYNIAVNVLCPTLVPTNIMKNGRLPSRYSGLADKLLMNHAFTTSDAVVKNIKSLRCRQALYHSTTRCQIVLVDEAGITKLIRQAFRFGLSTV
jgi:short-subunit dehydrogenase